MGASPSLRIRSLTVTRFRNFLRLHVDTEQKWVVLTGRNGIGKTNLLEAVSLLSPGRGLRGAKLSEMLYRPPTSDGEMASRCTDEALARTATSDEAARPAALSAAPSWVVAARLRRGDDELVTIGTGQAAGGAERRVLRIDGAAVRGQDALCRHLSVVWATPREDRLFLDSTTSRRRFFDRLVFADDPGHADRVSKYERAWRERRAVLTRAREYGQAADPAWLTALEQIMTETGMQIAQVRLNFRDRLTPYMARLREAGSFTARVEVIGGLEREISQSDRSSGEIAAITNRFSQSLAESRIASSKTTIPGPHRSDIMLYLTETGLPASMCSTGEQKRLLLGLLLAFLRMRQEFSTAGTVVLLDEASAHLDQQNRNALFRQLAELNAQVWLSGVESDLFSALPGQVCAISLDHRIHTHDA